MKEFIYTWNIENISYSWHRTGEAIFSPSFIAGPFQNSSWLLKVHPRGDTVSDYLGLYLCRGEDNGPEISINFELSCISSENVALHSFTVRENDKFFRSAGGFGHPRFMKRSEVFFRRKDLYLPRGVLTLRCRMWKDEGIAKEFEEAFGRTQLRIERILSVENVNPKFEKVKTICIHSERYNKSMMSVNMLHCEDSIKVVIDPQKVENIKFSVLSLSLLEKTVKKVISELSSSWLGSPKQEIWRLPALSEVPLNENEGSVQNNLELICEFVYSTGEETGRLENNCPNPSRLSGLVSKYLIGGIPSGDLSDCPGVSQSLWNLYVDQVFCDMELKTKTTSFFVHKAILCARSPVFSVMLSADMKEKMTKRIEIEDIAEDVLEKFIHFLYTDSFEDFEWEAVIGLHYAAEKYQVERLKILCISFLLKNINFDNVCELLILADRHQYSGFKRKVEDFILQHVEQVFSSSSWHKFVDEQPFLPAKTMLLRFGKEREKENDAESYEKILSKHPKVADDLMALYKGGISSDIVFKTKDTIYNVHKSVICAGSYEIRETLEGIPDNLRKPHLIAVFEMLDSEDDIVSRMLRFLYTDSFEDMDWDTAMKLYHEAYFNKIPRLIIKCSCFLLENLDISNASDLLLAAHKNQDTKLKSVVEDYIFLYDEEIFGSDKWADFSKTQPLLANETMRSKYSKNTDFSHL